MRVIGMISGTSFDAIEAVAAEFEFDGPDARRRPARCTSPPSTHPTLRAAIAALLPPAATTIEAVCRLDTAIGQRFAEVAAEVAEAALRRRGRRHLLPRPDRLPLGRGRARARDAAARPAGLHRRAHRRDGRRRRARARHRRGRARRAAREPARRAAARPQRRTRVRGSLNLGGISNVTVVGPGSEPLAYDIGPANALIDAVVAAETGGRESCDARRRARRARNGRRRAARPSSSTSRTTSWRPRSRPARSSSTSPTCVSRSTAVQIATDDLLATLTALSAETVAARPADSSAWPRWSLPAAAPATRR